MPWTHGLGICALRMNRRPSGGLRTESKGLGGRALGEAALPLRLRHLQVAGRAQADEVARLVAAARRVRQDVVHFEAALLAAVGADVALAPPHRVGVELPRVSEGRAAEPEGHGLQRLPKVLDVHGEAARDLLEELRPERVLRVDALDRHAVLLAAEAHVEAQHLRLLGAQRGVHGKAPCAQRIAHLERRRRVPDVPLLVQASTGSGPLLHEVLEVEGPHVGQGRRQLVLVRPHGEPHARDLGARPHLEAPRVPRRLAVGVVEVCVVPPIY